MNLSSKLKADPTLRRFRAYFDMVFLCVPLRSYVSRAASVRWLDDTDPGGQVSWDWRTVVT